MTLSVDSMDKNIVDILRRHPRGDGKPRRNTAGADVAPRKFVFAFAFQSRALSSLYGG